MTKMKKNLAWLAAALTLAILTAFVSTAPAHAAESATTGQTEAAVTFTAGELKLLSAPVLDFGSHTISDVEEEYEAVSVSTDARVSDLRGSGGGWTLMASLSPFALEGDGGPTLQAATIRITSPVVSAVNGNIGSPPKAVVDVELRSDGTETPVLQASADEGMGVWSLLWSAASTKLTVKPGTAQNGKSVATLTWSLQSAP